MRNIACISYGHIILAQLVSNKTDFLIVFYIFTYIFRSKIKTNHSQVCGIQVPLEEKIRFSLIITTKDNSLKELFRR